MIRKRTTLTASERKQRAILALFGVVLLGAALGIGMLLWQYPGIPTKWAGMLGMFFQTADGLFPLFVEASGSALLFLLLLYLVGFSAVGQPFAMFLLGCYGICMGGAFQIQCSSGHVLLRSIALLFYFVPLSVLMVVGTRESIRFSRLFSVYSFRDEWADNMTHRFRMYCVRFLVLVGFLLLLALLYSVGFYAGHLSLVRW